MSRDASPRDLDLDGTLTLEELEAVSPQALPEIDDRCQLDGSPIAPLSNMYAYARGQFLSKKRKQFAKACRWRYEPCSTTFRGDWRGEGEMRERSGSNSFDWLIVGGGLHGAHLAVRLIAEAGVDPQRLLILDPLPLLGRFRARTAATGMSHLRSPAVHHLGLHPLALRRFAKRRRADAERAFRPPYGRPRLRLFLQHSESLLDSHGLHGRHVRESVESIALHDSHVEVRAGGGLLACGPRHPGYGQ